MAYTDIEEFERYERESREAWHRYLASLRERQREDEREYESTRRAIPM